MEGVDDVSSFAGALGTCIPPPPIPSSADVARSSQFLRWAIRNVPAMGTSLPSSCPRTGLTYHTQANIAERVNTRFVLTTSLLGTTITCALFGTSTSLTQATVIRFAQGVFAGAIGVARGSVSNVTDASNESRAYAILGFCWGLGGVAGAVIGGLCASV